MKKNERHIKQSLYVSPRAKITMSKKGLPFTN